MSDFESGSEEQETRILKPGSNDSDDNDSDDNSDNNDVEEDSADDDSKENSDDDDAKEDSSSDEQGSEDDDSDIKSKVQPIKNKKQILMKKSEMSKNKNEKKQKVDLNKSETQEIPFDKSKKCKDIIKKYETLKGKQLFIRFPKKLPQKAEEAEKYVKNFNERIIKVRRPRQKSTKHCLIDFDNETDRDKAMKELRKVEIDGHKLIIALPKTENEEYLQKIKDYRIKKLEKTLEKKQAKKLGNEKQKSKLTSTLRISNIPSSATASDISKIFPDAVELRFTVAKGMQNTSEAIITLPSTKDATIAKKNKFKIGDNQLTVSYAVHKKGANPKEKNFKKGNANEANNKKQKRKFKMDKSETNEDETPPKKSKKNENKTKLETGQQNGDSKKKKIANKGNKNQTTTLNIKNGSENQIPKASKINEKSVTPAVQNKSNKKKNKINKNKKKTPGVKT